MIPILLLGAGRAGQFHAATLRASAVFRPVGVVDADAERAQALAEQLGCPFETDALRAMDSFGAEAVIIATTTHTHPALARQGLTRGLHVFSEKPLGALLEVRELYALSRSVGLVLQVGFQRRFDPEFIALREALGGRTPQILKLTSRDSPIPSEAYLRQSGGIVKDCMVHDIDIACWMMGGSAPHRFPVRVWAAGYAHHPDLKAWGEWEGVAATMLFDDGALALIDVSRTCDYGYDQRAEAFGAFGMLQLENRRRNVVVAHDAEGTHRANPLYSFPQRYPDAYRLELEHFADAILGSAECRILEEQVAAGDAICDAINRSLDTGLPQDVSLSER